MIPAWLIIGAVAFGIAFALNRVSAKNVRWFFRLRRPPWLTFEGAIPFIWIFIFTCGIISASLVWEATALSPTVWAWMAGYGILELLILAYTPVMCALRSLRVGTAIGAIGFVFGLGLAITVYPISRPAFGFLVPYLLWSPIGTYVTWAMIPLNPGEL